MTPITNAVPVEQMLAQEAQQIKARRAALEDRKSADKLSPNHYLGMACSGGGIRSGTFNLGILQGLARIGLLPYIDYLSTVSGGGYIGTWLHGVIKRCGGIEGAETILRRPECDPHLVPSKDPIAFLRKYSSYLAPDLGLFSADFWVILVIWFRNTALNQLMLIPFLALLVLLTFHAGFLREGLFGGGPSPIHVISIKPVASIIGILLLLVVVIAGTGVRKVVSPKECKKRETLEPGFFDQARWAVTCAALLLAAAAVLASSSGFSFGDTWSAPKFEWASVTLFGLFFILQASGGFLQCYRDRHPGRTGWGWLWLFVFPAVAAAATAVLVILTVDWMASWPTSWYVVAYGPPLVALIWIAGAGLHIGLMATDFPDSGREWFARVGAFLSIFLFAWAVLFTICIFAPPWIAGIWGLAAGLGLTGTWLATTLAGVASGISSKTSGKSGDPGKSNTLEIIGQIAPPVFVIGLLVVISFGVVAAIHALMPAGNLRSLQMDYWGGQIGWIETWYLTGILAAIVALLPARININEFSLHYFYKNRLVRCYLGASHETRNPSRLTGFDSCDDFPLATLLAKPTAIPPQGKIDAYYGPYPILCTTLNLNTGTDMAKRERKGTSFIFTPLYSGYDPPPQSAEDKRQLAKKNDLEKYGFRPTDGYSVPGGLDIGTCMGISGAAANPNWGYHTSAAVAFLLTIFDVRLGWWIGNSRRAKPSLKIGPSYALQPLLSELFAQTDERSAFLNLSDGGHFENLGLYELVRRRCRYIIVGDGEQDTGMTFESLGGAIRKCRIDFGVSIDLNPRPITLKEGLSSVHCVVGKITYPKDSHRTTNDPDHKPYDIGWILYLKSSLTGDEPEDVAQYKSAHADFPQEPTGNQFFTESQFESYRRLGLHVVESAFGNVTGLACKNGSLAKFQDRVEEKATGAANWMEHLFRCLEQQWYPPTDVPDTVKSHHAEAYTALLKRLGEDPDLGRLGAQVICPDGKELSYTAPPPDSHGPDSEKLDRKAFTFCLELIQLMENVWADLRLYEEKNRTNPKNRGWLTIFRYWAHQPIFHSTWKQAAYTFNPLFQQFFGTIQAQKAPEQTAPDCAALPTPSES